MFPQIKVLKLHASASKVPPVRRLTHAMSRTFSSHLRWCHVSLSFILAVFKTFIISRRCRLHILIERTVIITRVWLRFDEVITATLRPLFTFKDNWPTILTVLYLLKEKWGEVKICYNIMHEITCIDTFFSACETIEQYWVIVSYIPVSESRHMLC